MPLDDRNVKYFLCTIFVPYSHSTIGWQHHGIKESIFQQLPQRATPYSTAAFFAHVILLSSRIVSPKRRTDIWYNLWYATLSYCCKKVYTFERSFCRGDLAATQVGNDCLYGCHASYTHKAKSKSEHSKSSILIFAFFHFGFFSTPCCELSLITWEPCEKHRSLGQAL